jgi:Contractile injection system tape measure protein
MQHVIKKQVIELLIDKNLDSFNIQQQVSNHYLQQILPLLQEKFDDITTEDEILILDKLEIDIGIVSAAEISNIKIDNSFIKKIVEQTTELIKKEKIVGYYNTANTMPANSYRQWFYYMKKGYLPWNLIKTNEKWQTEVLQQLATDFNCVEALRKEILANKSFAKRIVQEHTTIFLSQLVSVITSKKQDLLQEVVNEMCLVVLNPNAADTLKKRTENILWQNILFTTARGEVKTTLDISKEVLKSYIANNQYKTDVESIKNIDDLKLLKPIVQQLQQENLILQQNAKDKNSLAVEEISLDKNKNVQIDEEGIFTALAGLVLLHPFLSSLFARLNLLQNKQFINEQAQENAVFILYYLATGNLIADEHVLVIPKILCGFAVENTVTKNIVLSETETKEADELLKAVIAQWDILKNTSPEGLRESFLHRNGKVFTKNNDIIIQVEKSSIDMLLDHLPWGLNIIKLPWVKQIIRVEWR